MSGVSLEICTEITSTAPSSQNSPTNATRQNSEATVESPFPKSAPLFIFEEEKESIMASFEKKTSETSYTSATQHQESFHDDTSTSVTITVDEDNDITPESVDNFKQSEVQINSDNDNAGERISSPPTVAYIPSTTPPKPRLIDSISFKFKSIFAKNESLVLTSVTPTTPSSLSRTSSNLSSSTIPTISEESPSVLTPVVINTTNHESLTKSITSLEPATPATPSLVPSSSQSPFSFFSSRTRSGSGIWSTSASAATSPSALSIPRSFMSRETVLKAQLDEENKKIWQVDILPTWPKYKNTRKIKKLCWHGIPSLVRGQVWRLLIGNPQNITSGLFHINAERAAKQRDERKLYLASLAPILEYPISVASNDSTLPQESEGVKNETPLSPEEALVFERERKQAEIAMQEAMLTSKYQGSSGFVVQAREYRSNEDTLTLIEKDLHRTMPELNLFGLSSPMGESLRRVLEAFVVYRPDVGYVQGMSYLGAILLLNLDTEAAFVAFVNILSNDNLVSFYRLEENGLISYMTAFEILFEKEMPILHAHFLKLEITADLYFYEWFSTVFARSFPLDIAHRVWDNFFCNGQVFLFRAALGYLRVHHDAFISQGGLPIEIILPLLCCPPKDLREDILFACIDKINLTDKQLSAALAEGLKPLV